MSCILLLFVLFYPIWHLQLTASSSYPAIAKPGCPDQCGNIKIPFPFGFGAKNCFHNEFYEITCNNASFGTPKPFLQKFNLEVKDINWMGKKASRSSFEMENEEILIVGVTLQDVCKSKYSVDFRRSPYLFSTVYNVLVVDGCGGSVVLKNRSRNILTGCAAVCVNEAVDIATKDCYGIGCCQASFITYNTMGDDYEGLDFYELEVDYEADSSACEMTAGLIDRRSVNKSAESTVSMVLEWSAPDPTPLQRLHFNEDCGCCYDYYEGSPYLPEGCQFVRDCRSCIHRCKIAWNESDGSRHYYCDKYPIFKWGSVLGFSLGLGLMVMLLGCYWLYRIVKRKKEAKRKSDYFKRNGGLLLQQQIGSVEGTTQKTRIFPVTELEKATDNFNKKRILGQGGQGTVYKGMLKDGRIVAIKKSKKVDESQLEQFVNEVVILSQINHRNVVKLLGCCLETEVPLLLYEFVQNGTLYEHIHVGSEDFHVTWKMRLQMAAESADAIAYLHSSSSSPIYHRDIKSANILLDSKYRAKVSDFGTSKSIEIEQTHVTTCVIGTYGYLDPEYFQSNQFTAKSDVYSFGVVLVELITGKKPICPTKDGGWISLAVEFLFHMENSRLFDILDARILEEGNEEEFVAFAKLARQCLKMNGKERPTMREVAMVLDEIRSSSHVPDTRESDSMAGKGVLMATRSDKHIGSSTTNMFFSDFGLGSSSIKFKGHTLRCKNLSYN
ncbi:wall-associated receptor kinase-like 8 [Amaranthus tricolor]|uniref:wall-associated receptor kinase-like 8 n=1 Tax=Amaranthus tricolor TaxID=29722 RepID=UPI00258F31C2|nr:wall-associated receptor kinase-like 8 [Amaranthus tricolor]